MKTVYEVTHDYEYQHLIPSSPSDIGLLMFACQPVIQTWAPLQMYNPMPFLKAGDFYNYDNSYLIVSEQARLSLENFFIESGEILPLKCEEPHCPKDKIWLINITRCINCLDHKRAKYKVGILEKYVFFEDRLPYPGLFKIPESVNVLVILDDRASKVDDFKYQVEILSIKGVQFTKLWESGD